jgi:hypothetical protein
MALEISYFTGAGTELATDSVYGLLTGSASATLSASSASCGTVPDGTRLARLRAGETCRVSNNGNVASGTNGIYLVAGDVMDVSIRPGMVLNALTA